MLQETKNNKNRFVVMGDVIDSRMFDQKDLRKGFKKIIQACNLKVKLMIVSPLTITLGDEFQGIVNSLEGAIRVFFFLEEERLRRQYAFRMRYVVHYGKIETPINQKIAYGMLGEGLTTARELLQRMKKDPKQYALSVEPVEKARQLERLFFVIQHLTALWKVKDYHLVLDMISSENNSLVAKRHKKNRTQIWKRRNTLMIQEYVSLKKFIFEYIKEI